MSLPSSCISSRNPPSHRSTLFPYTTLFRSPHRERAGADAGCAGRDPLAAVLPQFLGAARGEDRKSTRLNSSHRCISYAVFCLKKKKIITCKSFQQSLDRESKSVPGEHRKSQ